MSEFDNGQIINVSNEVIKTYTEEQVKNGIRIIVDKIEEVEAELRFCREHNFRIEAESLQRTRCILGSIRSKMQNHFDLLGEYIKPTNR